MSNTYIAVKNLSKKDIALLKKCDYLLVKCNSQMPIIFIGGSFVGAKSSINIWKKTNKGYINEYVKYRKTKLLKVEHALKVRSFNKLLETYQTISFSSKKTSLIVNTSPNKKLLLRGMAQNEFIEQYFLDLLENSIRTEV